MKLQTVDLDARSWKYDRWTSSRIPTSMYEMRHSSNVCEALAIKAYELAWSKWRSFWEDGASPTIVHSQVVSSVSDVVFWQNQTILTHICWGLGINIGEL